MLKMKKGCKVPFPEKLFEAYKIEENSITANIDTDKIEELIRNFIVTNDEPQFFILELPSNFDSETASEDGITDILHKDIYYIDGCTKDMALAILIKAGELLINDGLCSFGFGCHKSGDEIMFGKYNIMTIFSHNIAQYERFLERYNVSKTDNLITAWDTFSYNHPGVSERYKSKGKTVFDIPETFKDWGIYFAERREEN